MNKQNLYIWACDLSKYTGEGNLGNLFLKKKFEHLYNVKIIKPKSKIFLKNSFFKNKYITPVLGIFYCWKLYLLNKKICYLNYLPLWNTLIFALLPPSSLIGPITGGSNYKKEFSVNYFLRKFFLPLLFKLSIFFINIRKFKTIFATNLLIGYLNSKLKTNSDFNFFLEGIKIKKIKKIKKSIDFIIYYRKHSNKQQLYPINFIKKLIEYKFKLIVVGDRLNENGVRNLGYLNKKKLEIILSKTKFFISSGENIYNFFAIDCINNNVKILSSYKPIKIGKKFDKNIIYYNTQKDLKRKQIRKLLKKF